MFRNHEQRPNRDPFKTIIIIIIIIIIVITIIIIIIIIIIIKTEYINTYKYHVQCSDGKISVRIILITYFSTFVTLTSCVFFPVGLSSLTRHFQKVL